jgi:hypothetical protein
LVLVIVEAFMALLNLTSRLAKEYGWGINYNEDRRLALVGCEMKEYQRLARRAQDRGTAVTALRTTKGSLRIESREANDRPPSPERQTVPNRREPIPKSVKMYVWQRDGGRCVECGSKEKLEYDHIIPLAKGAATRSVTFSYSASDATVPKVAT